MSDRDRQGVRVKRREAANMSGNELENSLTIEVYSDVICPWCFIGKRRLEMALALHGGARIAAGAGLDRSEVDAFLGGDQGVPEVRGEEERGKSLGLDGVPFFLIGGRVALSGAQEPEMIREAIERAVGLNAD
jgi:predicted DsbA family dithiol-disulfide isomerase